RPTLDGKKTLFIEEAQSDWAQKGRSEGYNDPNVRSALERQIADLEQERRELMHNSHGPQGAADDKQIARYDEINRTLTGVKRTFNATHKGAPDMPFKQNWHARRCHFVLFANGSGTRYRVHARARAKSNSYPSC